MNGIFPRRSVTVDEAVAILLGRADGPIEFRAMTDDVSEEEQEALDGLSYVLQDELNDELENLEGLLAAAKYDEQPAAIIEERRIALERHRQVIKQAYGFLAAIEDELSKGERSALRIDTELSSRVEKYITRISLDDWAKQYGRTVLAELQKTTGTTPPAIQPQPNVASKPKPRMTMRQQEDAIVAHILERGYTPMTVPKNFSGISGIKAEIRAALEESPLFNGITVFDKAWERVTNKKK